MDPSGHLYQVVCNMKKPHKQLFAKLPPQSR